MTLLEEIYCDVVVALSMGASGKSGRTLLANELRAIRNRLEPMMPASVRENAAHLAERFRKSD